MPVFKWVEKLRKLVDEANASSNIIENETKPLPERPPSAELTSEQTERLVSMICEFEARGLKLGPNIDRRAAANLIFEEYWEEWGGHPSMPSEFGVIPRHMMLYHLASDEIDWSETQPDDTNRLLENACNCSDKFEGDPAKLMWDLTGITSGDIILEGGYNERLENVVIAGKKHRIPWEEMSSRDFLAPLFKLAELLPRENKKKYGNIGEHQFTVVYAEKAQIKALSQFLGDARIWRDDTQAFFSVLPASVQAGQIARWNYDLAACEGVPIDQSALEVLAAINLESTPRKSRSPNDPEILRVTEICIHDYESFHQRLWQVHKAILKNRLFIYDYSCELIEQQREV